MHDLKKINTAGQGRNRAKRSKDKEREKEGIEISAVCASGGVDLL